MTTDTAILQALGTPAGDRMLLERIVELSDARRREGEARDRDLDDSWLANDELRRQVAGPTESGVLMSIGQMKEGWITRREIMSLDRPELAAASPAIGVLLALGRLHDRELIEGSFDGEQLNFPAGLMLQRIRPTGAGREAVGWPP